MIVLGRKVQQRITIGDNIEIVVVKITGNQVSIGVAAPRAIRVVRTELIEQRLRDEENDSQDKAT
jgi:carbon storage regulator